MAKKYCLLFLFVFISSFTSAQVENVPIDNEVYSFLQAMNVKKIIENIHDDNPSMSRSEVKNFLTKIEAKSSLLSTTEKELLAKYKDEFFEENLTKENSTMIFDGGNVIENLGDIVSQKIKYLYHMRDGNNTLFIDWFGHYYHGQEFESKQTNTELFDIGVRMRGTVFDHLGYYFMINKGGIAGSNDFASVVDPRLKTNFKYIEAIENIGNYDYTEGYLKYYTEFSKNMNLALQIGRETIKFGRGYGSNLVFTDEHPPMDFLKFDFNWGIFNFTSIHASTVGEYHMDHSLNYTKFFAMNKFRLAFPDLFDLGLGETIVYSDRGLDLAYLNPFLFYKFAEMSLQDRDNGAIYFDLQTHFIKDFQFQGTFFLDENILSHLQELQLFSNKTAYQLGALWYSPLGINDLSFTTEYTRIRPYVYSHSNNTNDSYSSYGVLVGHRIGPNADEIMTRLSYNLNARVRFNLEYRHVRSGKDVYDSEGNLIRNVGGDWTIPYRYYIDATDAPFLDGVRVNNDILIAGMRVEPFREIYFDFVYNLMKESNLTYGTSNTTGYGLIKMTIEY